MSNRNKKDNSSYEVVFYLFIIIIAIYMFVFLLKFIVERPWILIFPLIVIGIFIYMMMTRRKKIKNKRLFELEKNSTIGGLFNEFATKPQEFEVFVANLYESQGYKTYVTKGSNDGGKDIVMYKDGIRCVVEVKLYATNNKVGREKIQKLHSAMMDEKASRAIFVTTSEFTSPAIDYAEKFGIELINAEKLVELIIACKSNF